MVRQRPHDIVIHRASVAVAGGGAAEELVHHDAVQVRGKIEPLPMSADFRPVGIATTRAWRMMLNIPDADGVEINGLVTWNGLRLRVAAPPQTFSSNASTSHVSVILEEEPSA